MNRPWMLGSAFAATLVLLAACSPAAPQASTPPPAAVTPSGPPGSAAGGTTKTSDGGQVTVVVDWAGPTAGAVFAVTLDTHSVDLDAVDLAGAVLRNDRGEALTAAPWAAPAGGHHRQGPLTFRGDTDAFLAGARWVELVLTGVGDLAERTLRWEIGP